MQSRFSGNMFDIQSNKGEPELKNKGEKIQEKFIPNDATHNIIFQVTCWQSFATNKGEKQSLQIKDKIQDKFIEIHTHRCEAKQKKLRLWPR